MEQNKRLNLIYRELSEVETMRQLEGVPHETVIMMASRACEIMIVYIYREEDFVINDLGFNEREDWIPFRSTNS